MESLKMSDVFDGELVQDADTLFANGYGELADFSGYKKEARYVAHAVNDHDRLVEENAELREALSDLSKKFEHTINCQGKNPEMWGAFRKAKELLAKNK